MSFTYSQIMSMIFLITKNISNNVSILYSISLKYRLVEFI